LVPNIFFEKMVDLGTTLRGILGKFVEFFPYKLLDTQNGPPSPLCTSKKIQKKYFTQKYFFWCAKYLFGPYNTISLIFSTRKELDSDLNAGRLGVHGQLYGKISEEARKGPE